ncbi:MAG: Ketose-bisphosphate aldolase, class-II [Parcubacteria group bacterium Gr01-1014_72]|nr:MAG: Ketose-bisphosphate aldolase, class-II [Parcubacteria group bacterium Gr01-1014_72]
MKTLRQAVSEAEKAGKAVGHFNVSTLDALYAIARAARAARAPVIIGVSEGERSFVGVRQIAAVVKSLREEGDTPIFLNADHSYSIEKVQEAVDAGYDAVIFDGAKLSLDENIKITKRCVAYAREKNPNILMEGELGYIGTSSSVRESVAGVGEMTTPETATRFVKETGVELFAPAVGNLHGMRADGTDPSLDIPRIKAIREAVGIPLVLHGASGNTADDIRNAIEGGVAIVHINTEIRVAYRKALAKSLTENPDEVAPYKYLKPAASAVEAVVAEKLKVFGWGP